MSSPVSVARRESEDLKAKAAQRYDQALEADARNWIESVLEVELEGTLHDNLKSGVVLCNLVNAVDPKARCKTPSNSAAPFKQRENISFFLAACADLGIPGFKSFQTVDLYEAKDMQQVLLCISALGTVAQKLGYAGPAFGAKPRVSNRRDFTELSAQVPVCRSARCRPHRAPTHPHNSDHPTHTTQHSPRPSPHASRRERTRRLSCEAAG
jgi:hypothetical protein